MTVNKTLLGSLGGLSSGLISDKQRRKSEYNMYHTPFGFLFNEPFDTLDKWTTVGGTFSPSAGVLSVSGGSVNYTSNYIYYPSLPNAMNAWKITCPVIRITSATANIGIGFITIPGRPNRFHICRIATSGGNYNVSIVSGNAGAPTGRDTSTNQPFSVNDEFRLIFERNFNTYTATCVNVTAGTQRTASWTTTNAVTANSSGYFGIINNDGTAEFRPDSTGVNFKVESGSRTNIRCLFIGDSITQSIAGGTNRYPNVVFSGSNRVFEVNAGPSDGIDEFQIQQDHILSYNAQYTLLMIGGNNIQAPETPAATMVKYQDLYNKVKAKGSIVIHCLATPRDAVDMTAWNALLQKTFTNDLVIDTFTPLKGSGTDLAAAYDQDGVHPNTAGHALIGATIRNAAPFLY